MNEEEKEAIEETRLVVEHFDDENYLISYRHENLSVLLNCIDKLQKELDKIREVEMEVIKENTCLGEKVDEQARMIDKLQKENEELKNGIRINTEIHKRDERIKELEEINACLHETAKDCFISKEKIREIIYPSSDNMIPLEVQTSDMYRKLNDLVKE